MNYMSATPTLGELQRHVIPQYAALRVVKGGHHCFMGEFGRNCLLPLSHLQCLVVQLEVSIYDTYTVYGPLNSAAL